MRTDVEDVAIDSVERLSAMSESEVNELPYGFLILDRDGTILLYNRYESRMSRLPSDRVVGRGWFSDVAPCTRVAAFFGRFRRMVDDPSITVDRFAFRFHFHHGAQDVLVQLARAPGDGERIFMTVVRRNVDIAETRTPPALALDDDTGALRGPAGVMMALGVSALASLLDGAGAHAARAVGADIGRAVAANADVAAKEMGEPSLSRLPPLLASGMLDQAIARAGLGRVALDSTVEVATGVLGVMVRPPAPASSIGLAAFYEGVLAALVGSALGRPVVARCLDADHTTFPVLFAIADESRAGELTRRGHESAEDVAERLGIFRNV